MEFVYHATEFSTIYCVEKRRVFDSIDLQMRMSEIVDSLRRSLKDFAFPWSLSEAHTLQQKQRGSNLLQGE
jgi:hypothetical protein